MFYLNQELSELCIKREIKNILIKSFFLYSTFGAAAREPRIGNYFEYDASDINLNPYSLLKMGRGTCCVKSENEKQ